MTVAYECDREACDTCSYPMCSHTTDIEHAKNFKKFPEDKYFEERTVDNNLDGGNRMEKLKQQLIEAENKMNALAQQLDEAEDECARLQDELREAEKYQEMYDMGYDVGKQLVPLIDGLKAAGLSQKFAEDLIKTSLKASLQGTPLPAFPFMF